MISIRTKLPTIGYISQNYIIELTYTGTLSINSNKDWATGLSITSNSFTLAINKNNSYSNRSATLTLTDADSTKTIYIYQQGKIITPIYQPLDIVIETEAEAIDYTITTDDNQLLFTGTAYKYPLDNAVRIDTNSIVSNYLNSNFQLSKDTSYAVNADLYREFYLVANDVKYPFQVYNSYYYNNVLPLDNNVMILSEFINNKIDYRQYFLLTFVNPLIEASEDYTLTLEGRTENNMPFLGTRTYSVNNMAYTITESQLNKNINKITIFDKEFEVMIDSCCKYCLYYQSALGGWASFLIQGNDLKKDTITRSNMKKSITSTKSRYATENYSNNIKTEHKLYTHYLTDEESSKMFNLIESTNVLMHNLETNEITKVYITNGDCIYKTYQNNGNKVFLFEITCIESEEKIRK